MMWDFNYILDIASRKIGITPEEIRKMPWGEIEEKMGVAGVSNYGSNGLVNLEDAQILTKQRFFDREKETMEFLKSFYNKKEKRR